MITNLIIVSDTTSQNAIAIIYEANTNLPPRIVARGINSDAIDMINLAKDHDIEIFYNNDITVICNDEIMYIPSNLYEPVADMMAYASSKNRNKSDEDLKIFITKI